MPNISPNIAMLDNVRIPILAANIVLAASTLSFLNLISSSYEASLP